MSKENGDDVEVLPEPEIELCIAAGTSESDDKLASDAIVVVNVESKLPLLCPSSLAILVIDDIITSVTIVEIAEASGGPMGSD